MDDANLTKSLELPDVSLQHPLNGSFACPFEGGDVIGGRYEVQGLIGFGEVGFVLAAIDVRSGEDVALKFLRPELVHDQDMVRRFRVEAMRYTKVESPHVVQVRTVDALSDGTPYMVMELLRGQDLGRALERGGPLSVERAVDAVLQACEGLAAAQAAGVKHFDLKPASLFLSGDADGTERVVIIDFGATRGSILTFEYVSSGDTLVGIGSPLDFAAQQERNASAPDDRSDVRSLGCVLYELVAGESVFARGSDPDVARDSIIIDEGALGPRLSCATIPPDLEVVIRRCLAREPSDRYGDVAELALALTPFAPETRCDVAERCYDQLAGRRVSSGAPRAPEPEATVQAPRVEGPSWNATAGLMAVPSRSRLGSKLVAAAAVGASLFGYAWYSADAGRFGSAPAAVTKAEATPTNVPVPPAASPSTAEVMHTSNLAAPADVRPEPAPMPQPPASEQAVVNPNDGVTREGSAGGERRQVPAAATKPKRVAPRPKPPRSDLPLTATGEPDVGF